ncbi:hypothetical protein ONS95_011901 [Cadophora gregata]|uniref:uncharacterized protein n=1 Tax=Cadophora gregata TaxID=51156 RepID=UPI0026DD2151|nr:uncharacterized protein ONS95_011901 [Cadophora gregata]KAK0117565.1 hypothetical protein ONS95_011901 [Cadophora gregata]KAK0122616.1 hypothetical protein ONS96_009656 [Cadophora gregata f. sp. sojae]
MDVLVDRVVNGRIFKNFASFVRGDSRNLKEAADRSWTANYGKPSEPRSSRTTSIRDGAELVSQTRERRASEANCTSVSPTTSIMDIEHCQSRPHLDYGSETFQDEFHESRSSFSQSHHSPDLDAKYPPLTSRYLKIFTFQGEFGEVGTGLALTKNLVWQLNAVYRSENKANEYEEAIHEIDRNLADWGSLASELPELIERAADDDDRNGLLKSLHDAEKMVMMNEEKRLHLVERYQYWTAEKGIPLKQMLQNLNVVLGSNNLLEETPPESEVDFENSETGRYDASSVSSPSPSDIAREELETEKQMARDILHERRLRLQETQERVDHWNDYYEAEYNKFLHLPPEGILGATKTDFDTEMVRQGQAATRACIEAEEDLDDAIEYARILKVDFEHFDQESGFISHVEDGHIESMDPTKVYTVDKARVERWMSDQNEAVETSGDFDDWECKSIGLYDSISIVGAHIATGKHRKRIDRWRAMCELNLRDIDAETI